MTLFSARQALAWSNRLYRQLLLIYPASFRRDFGPEMAQLFADLCRDAVQQRGLSGLILLWLEVLREATATAFAEHLDEWRNDMEPKKIIPSLFGIIFLLYSTAFALVNILIYNLGVNIGDPFSGIVNRPQPSLGYAILSSLIVLGPALAFGFFLLPNIHVKLDWRAEEMATITIHKANILSLILIGLCVAVGSLFVLYYLGENIL